MLLSRFRFSISVILPLLFSVAIYLIYRQKDLVIFNLLDAVDLNRSVLAVRGFFSSSGIYAPNWLIYNLPGSLWMLSILNFLLYIWQDKITKQNILWFFLPFGFAVGLEFMQLLHITDGTFDILDIVFYVAIYVCFLSLNFIKEPKRTESKNRPPSFMHTLSFVYMVSFLIIVYGSDKA